MEIAQNLSREVVKSLATDYTSLDFTGIVSGINRGELWVTDIEAPKLAIAYSEALQQYCVLGKTTGAKDYDKVQEFLLAIKKPFVVKFDCPETETELMKRLKPQIKSQTVESTYQRIIPFKEKEMTKSEIYDYQKITEESKLKRIDLYEKSWSSFEKFTEYGLCFAAEKNLKTLAAVIGTGYSYKKMSAHFMTKEANEKPKVLAHLLKLFTNACTEKGFITSVTLNEQEEAKIRMVKALNFIYVKKCNCYTMEA